ncbi:g6860 [Coccomyxa viridis]|uniref:G6860 protein n=1 Tax=Coccomyxa viridis TaxID=1274662 RepID=A0ABP1FWE1_9CHLO
MPVSCVCKQRELQHIDPGDAACVSSLEWPVPETEDDWYQVECILNTLNYAQPQTLEIQSCFLDTAVRTYIVEDFVYTCQRATVLPLWDRITAFCDAPHVALRWINMDTDDKYKDLEKCIFARAREDSRPPKKFEHPYYDRYCKSGIVHAELTEAMDDILMLVTYAMHAHREGELQPCGRPASQCQPAQSG